MWYLEYENINMNYDKNIARHSEIDDHFLI